MPNAVRIPLAKFIHLMSFTAPEKERRQYLTGVHVEDGVIVATTGFNLGAYWSEEAKAEKPVILRAPKAALSKMKEFAKSFSWYQIEPVIRVDIPDGTASGPVAGYLTKEGDDEAAATGLDRQVILELVDGAFPDWRKVFPDGPLEPIERGLVSLNSASMPLFRTEKQSIVVLYQGKPNSEEGGDGAVGPMIVLIEGVSDFAGMTMAPSDPRTTTESRQMPAFIAERLKKKAEPGDKQKAA